MWSSPETDALHSLCAPNADVSFTGDLGSFTPCFVDIIILSEFLIASSVIKMPSDALLLSQVLCIQLPSCYFSSTSWDE